jgi:hypothetical protein
MCFDAFSCSNFRFSVKNSFRRSRRRVVCANLRENGKRQLVAFATKTKLVPAATERVVAPAHLRQGKCGRTKERTKEKQE